MSDVFAHRLKGRLDAQNIQQKSIAATLKVSPAVFSAWIKCKSEPSLDMLARICQELNISADYLIGLTDSMKPPVSVPVSIPSVTVQRKEPNPLEELDPDLRSKAEGYIDSLLELQKDRSLENKKEEKA